MTVRRAVTRCVRTAVATAVLAACAAAAAGVARADDDGTTPVEHLTLSPVHGGAHTAVRVRAQCATGGPAGGTAASPAFVHSVPVHRDAHGDATATAVVRSGLTPGTRYVVTVNCSQVENLSASFAYTGRRPAGATHAGFAAPTTPPAPPRGPRRPTAASTRRPWPCGGGLAAVGLAGDVSRSGAPPQHGAVRTDEIHRSREDREMTTRQERLSRRSRRLEATAVSVAVALTALLYQLVPQAAADPGDGCRTHQHPPHSSTV